jgi:putative transposase
LFDVVIDSYPLENWSLGESRGGSGGLRDKCLNLHWFETLEEAKVKIEAWRVHYNESRPQRPLGGIPPRAFADQAGRSTEPQGKIVPETTLRRGRTSPGGSVPRVRLGANNLYWPRICERRTID